MKKLLYLFLAATLFGATFYFFKTKQTIEHKIHIPEAGMVNPQKRLEREIRMLADPATGKIPEGIRSKELAFAQTLPVGPNALRGSGYNWKAQGPFNVGGRTRAAAVDINDENILIAGGNSGAIYRSTDGGQSWTKAETPYMAVGASCIAQDTRTNKTDTWYVGTGERYSSASGSLSSIWIGNGILKSTDNGLTWDTLTATTTNTPQTYNPFDKVWNIAIDPTATNDELYVATNSAIYKSTDGGDSFTAVLTSNNGGAYGYSDVMCTPSGILYATFGSSGSGKGIYRSTDGDTWTVITPTTEIGSSYNRIVMCYDPQDENTLYFFANTPGIGHETFNFMGNSEFNSLLKYEYVSGDGSGAGGVWTNLSANLPIGPYLFDDLNVQGSYDMLVRVKPDDSNTIILGGTNLYKSTDGFTTPDNYTQIGGYKEDTELPLFEMYPNHHPDQHTVFFSPTNNNVMYSGNDGGLMKTSDITASTVVWESLNNGYLTTQFYTIAIDHAEESNTIIGGLQDNGSQFTNSADETANWTMSFSYDGAYCAIPDSAPYYIMSIQSGRMAKLELDNNGNMTAYRRIDPIVPNPNVYDFINPFILDPVDNDIMYLSVGNKLWRNNELSAITISNEWDSITQGWTELSGTASGNISSFGVTYSGSHTLYIGTDGGKIYKLDNANDQDATFQDISSGISGFVSSLSVDPRDDNKVLAVISNYNAKSVYYTEDGGTTWWRASGNMEGEPTIAIAPETYTNGPYPSCRWGKIVPLDNGATLYLLGTSVGLFATDRLVLGTDYESDTTVWWQQSPDLIGNSIVTMIDYRESDGFTAVATHGAGVFTANITNTWQMTDIEEKNAVSLNVYPNPCTDVIHVTTLNNQTPDLTIYDMKGSKLRTINQSNKVVVSDLKPGAYIMEVSQKDNSSIRKQFIKK